VNVSVAGRYLFYKGSAFDVTHDGAIATDKTALLPGQAATFANYTSYDRGINGVMIDVAGPVGALMAADFVFKAGNDMDPAGWADVPSPVSVTLRPGFGVNGSTRVEIVWADGVIAGEWLQVTLKGGAGATSNLPADDVFYFGNAIGESGNSATDAAVTTADVLAARGRISASAVPIDNAWDYNRDGIITSADMAAAQGNLTAGAAVLVMLAAPALPLSEAVETPIETATLVLPVTESPAPAAEPTTVTTVTIGITDVTPTQTQTPATTNKGQGLLHRNDAALANGANGKQRVLDRLLSSVSKLFGKAR